MTDMRAHLFSPLLLAVLVSGCAHAGWLPPPSIEQQLQELRDSSAGISEALTSLADNTRGNPLWVKETALADITLEMGERAVRARWGSPKSINEQLPGTWWSFKGHSGDSPSWSLKVHMQGDALNHPL
jgi:hypothetical protein